MWLLENAGDVFEGRRLWLRPGKTYLFGRTTSEAGQLAISHKTISRKHLTIRVDKVPAGDSQNLSRRSEVTLEDLGTKLGTTVNGQKIKGDSIVATQDSTQIQLGTCPELFTLTWHPVVLTFSFTSREMQADPLANLRSELEPLDIKLTTDYIRASTTHVVAKKRNTSKGLQALINGRYIVADSFIDAIAAVAAAPEDGEPTDSSALEQDFDGYWPNPLDHLPPRGGEPVERPSSAYAPALARQDIFDGYTFIFYERTQYDNLLAPITNGSGKALITQVTPGVTEVDDFVRYVKTEAGEKGLGSFDDGSEGKGVVVVRYLPNKGGFVEWYGNFFTNVSLRLDHRPIEQNEFIEAILIQDASILRRPLEIDTGTQDGPQNIVQRERAVTEQRVMDLDQSVTSQQALQASIASEPAPRRGRVRRAPTRRFVGFDDDGDADESTEPAVPESHSLPYEEGLFVSQDPMSAVTESARESSRRSNRKRPASPQPDEDDIMEDIMPTAAAAKRRRIEAGDDPVAHPASTNSTTAAELQKGAKVTRKKIKKEIDILDVARQRREEMEARALAEKEDLARLPPDVDLEQIRRLNIVEEMEVRRPPSRGGGEEDNQNGRWDPRWNGRKNFKRFRQRNAPTGRPLPKVIVSLTEVKKKDFGIGDDYWLEDDSQRKKKGADSQGGTSGRETQSQPKAPPPPPRRVVISDVSDDEVEEEPSEIVLNVQPSLARTRGTRSSAATTQTQSTPRTQSQVQTQAKRPAPPPAKAPPAKKPRTTRQAIEVRDSDESDDELKFKFGRRR